VPDKRHFAHQEGEGKFVWHAYYRPTVLRNLLVKADEHGIVFRISAPFILFPGIASISQGHVFRQQNSLNYW
jgi:hypothetical protein